MTAILRVTIFIKRWYRQFKQTGTVPHRKCSGRPRLCEAVVEQVNFACEPWRARGSGLVSFKRHS